MWARALVVVFGIACAETLHGIARTLWVTPRLGDLRARQVGVLTGSLLILAIATLAIRWLGPRTGRQKLAIGALWLVCMLAFEIGLGRALGRIVVTDRRGLRPGAGRLHAVRDGRAAVRSHARLPDSQSLSASLADDPPGRIRQHRHLPLRPTAARAAAAGHARAGRRLRRRTQPGLPAAAWLRRLGHGRQPRRRGARAGSRRRARAGAASRHA